MKFIVSHWHANSLDHGVPQWYNYRIIPNNKSEASAAQSVSGLVQLSVLTILLAVS